MRFGIQALLLCAMLGAPTGAGLVARQLSGSLPAGIPGPAVLREWEEVAGEIDLEGGSVVYRFYVAPARAGLYQLTQYQVEEVAQTDQGPQQQQRSEKVIWNAHPGQAFPLELYEREGRGWTRIPAGTPLYHAEMMLAIRLYQLHNLVTHGNAP